jgi:hypothetical protein
VDGRGVLTGAARGVVGALTMTGLRTLGSQVRLLDTGTPPESVAEEGLPQLVRPFPARWRPAVVDLMHLGYGAAGGAAFSLLPRRWRRRWYSGPVFGLVLWLGYITGIAPVLGLRIERRRDLREWAVLAVDHVLYGLVVARLGGRDDQIR